MMYNPEKCLHCLRCVSQCARGCHTQENGKHAFDREQCLACGACLSPLCEALECAGQEMTVDEILSEILKDLLYYQNSGGGVTLSGGEPLSQKEFAKELLQKVRAHGIHTCVETCGHVSSQTLTELLPLVDLFLFDWKESDPNRHKQFTGADNRLILENLRLLDRAQKEIVLRCPIIPTLNDREDHLLGIAELANSSKSISRVVIEPYHTLGAGKYERLGRSYSLSTLSALDAEHADRFVERLQTITRVPVEKA